MTLDRTSGHTFSHARADFPGGFTFGAATAAFQIEGGAEHRGPSHWDDLCATPGTIRNGHDGLVACDHYHRWEEDLDLLAGAGFDAYRFSISWPRVLPTGGGEASEGGIAFYDRLVDGMLERGLRPHATLYHWDLPSALADAGGWRSRDTAERFADYAALVARRLGDRLRSVATLNEPYCAAWLGHFVGVHAPGLRDVRAAARAMHHLLLAHGLGVRAMRAEGARNLGIVTNHNLIEPVSDAAGNARQEDRREEDRRAAVREDAIQNRWFWEGLHRARYPDEALAGLRPHMPAGFESDMATVAEPIDWHGINYYRRDRIAAAGGRWPATREEPAAERGAETTGLGWEVHPEGLTAVLERVASYTGELPLYVTENGAAYPDPELANGGADGGADDGIVDDAPRVSFYDRHLAAAREAIARGVPLRGYFAWSLLDNFEWAEGYGERFGLCHVDYDTQRRTPKASYHAFRAMLAGG